MRCRTKSWLFRLRRSGEMLTHTRKTRESDENHDLFFEAFHCIKKNTSSPSKHTFESMLLSSFLRVNRWLRDEFKCSSHVLHRRIHVCLDICVWKEHDWRLFCGTTMWVWFWCANAEPSRKRCLGSMDATLSIRNRVWDHVWCAQQLTKHHFIDFDETWPISLHWLSCEIRVNLASNTKSALTPLESCLKL